MIGVNLQADWSLLGRVDAYERATTAHRFRQGDGCAPMQDAIWLHRALLHRHSCLQIIFPNFEEFNTQMTYHRVRIHLVELFNCILLKPNRHVLFFLFVVGGCIRKLCRIQGLASKEAEGRRNGAANQREWNSRLRGALFCSRDFQIAPETIVAAISKSRRRRL